MENYGDEIPRARLPGRPRANPDRSAPKKSVSIARTPRKVAKEYESDDEVVNNDRYSYLNPSPTKVKKLATTKRLSNAMTARDEKAYNNATINIKNIQDISKTLKDEIAELDSLSTMASAQKKKQIEAAVDKNVTELMELNTLIRHYMEAQTKIKLKYK